MTRILLIVLLSLPLFLMAQTPRETADEEAGQVQEESAADADPEPEVDDPDSAIDEGAIGIEASDVVEETLPPAPPEDLGQAEEEFEPDEEISEDYPVPLPSDI